MGDYSCQHFRQGPLLRVRVPPHAVGLPVLREAHGAGRQTPPGPLLHVRVPLHAVELPGSATLLKPDTTDGQRRSSSQLTAEVDDGSADSGSLNAGVDHLVGKDD